MIFFMRWFGYISMTLGGVLAIICFWLGILVGDASWVLPTLAFVATFLGGFAVVRLTDEYDDGSPGDRRQW
jgi:hypothetical protein